MHQTKQPQHKSRLTTAQLEALIPAGPVSRHRAARDDEIESIAEGNRGDTIVTGQRVVDPIMRLHRAGHISIQEVQAAFTFRRDHDRAYATSSNVLTSLCVDSGGSREHALDKQLRTTRRAIAVRSLTSAPTSAASHNAPWSKDTPMALLVRRFCLAPRGLSKSGPAERCWSQRSRNLRSFTAHRLDTSRRAALGSQHKL
jgi:hypothetical protein